MRNFFSRINQDNFVLYFSSLVGVLVLLSALGLSVYVVTRPEPLRPPAQARVCASQLDFYPYRTSFLPGQDIFIQVILDTEEQAVLGTDIFIGYDSTKVIVNEVEFGENAFDEGIFNLLKRVTDDTIEMHFLTFAQEDGPTDPVIGDEVHLATLWMTVLASEGEEFMLTYNFAGCGVSAAQMSVVAIEGSFENALRSVRNGNYTVEIPPTQPPTPTATATPVATPTEVLTPTVTPTVSFVPTPTPTPLPTGAPTPTHTPIPTPTPTPECFNEIDYNCDGKTSAVDFGLWLEMFIDYVHSDGQIYDPSADLNNDGKISALDFAVFLSLYQ